MLKQTSLAMSQEHCELSLFQFFQVVLPVAIYLQFEFGLKQYSPLFSQKKQGLANANTYLLAVAFIAGNLILPQICHLIPNGGFILLPIFFFTLIAAYKYGLATGLMTAILSPTLNFALFGMPSLFNTNLIH